MRPIHLLSLVLFLAFAAATAEAAHIKKSFPFELDKWYALDVVDGEVTIHRIRVREMESNFKTRVFRPSNSEFAMTVQIQVEYTNDSSRDVEADLDIVWVDGSGHEIDGYRDDEDMDEGEKDDMTMTFSTSKYGLEKAKTLQVEIDF
jgi:hypothetical protein